jgi:hypothetical protein
MGKLRRIEGSPMVYRVYLFDSDGQLVAGRWFEATHDLSALKIVYMSTLTPSYGGKAASLMSLFLRRARHANAITRSWALGL